MSRSDSTDPRQQHDRWMRLGWNSWPLPRGTGRRLRREWQKTQRQRERAALRQGNEPEPSRPRHSVHWNYW